MKTLLLATLLAALSPWTLGVALACNVPVFQYALEFWDTDPYQITVRKQGELTEDQQAAADLLQRAADAKGSVANVNVTVVEADEEEGNAPLPGIEVRYPRTVGARPPAWTGELTLDNARAVLDSPARKKIGELLLKRQSAVWVLLDGGDRRLDDEVAATLEKALRRMEQTLELPELTEWEAAAGEIATTIDFSMVRLRRDDPAERVFVKMLLGTERDLAGFDDVPMVFPIYGRGRSLYALVNKGINEWTLTSAGEFLVGPCSCVIKANNPGVDLLMSVDWDANVERLAPDATEAPAGLSTFLDRQAEAERHFQDEDDKTGAEK